MGAKGQIDIGVGELITLAISHHKIITTTMIQEESIHLGRQQCELFSKVRAQKLTFVFVEPTGAWVLVVVVVLFFSDTIFCFLTGVGNPFQSARLPRFSEGALFSSDVGTSWLTGSDKVFVSDEFLLEGNPFQSARLLRA